MFQLFGSYCRSTEDRLVSCGRMYMLQFERGGCSALIPGFRFKDRPAAAASAHGIFAFV